MAALSSLPRVEVRQYLSSVLSQLDIFPKKKVGVATMVTTSVTLMRSFETKRNDCTFRLRMRIDLNELLGCTFPLSNLLQTV